VSRVGFYWRWVWLIWRLS